MNIFKNFEDFVKWLTSVLSCLIAFSIIKSFLFFNSFGIKITNYLSFSECLLLFIDEISIFCWYTLLISTSYLMLFIITKRFVPQIKVLDFLILNWNGSNLVKTISLFIYGLPILYLSKAFILFVYDFTTTLGFVFLTFLVAFYLIFAIVFIYRKGDKISKANKNIHTVLILYLTFIFTVCFYTSSLRRQMFLFHVNKVNQYVACYDKSGQIIIESSFTNNVQYIGSTKEYIFFYNIESKKTNIYRLSSFEKIEIGQKKFDKIPGSSIFDVLY